MKTRTIRLYLFNYLDHDGQRRPLKVYWATRIEYDSLALDEYDRCNKYARLLVDQGHATGYHIVVGQD